MNVKIIHENLDITNFAPCTKAKKVDKKNKGEIRYITLDLKHFTNTFFFINDHKSFCSKVQVISD